MNDRKAKSLFLQFEACILTLRYFNPVGADPEQRIGEMPLKELPPNLMPKVCAAAQGHLEHVPIFGTDYSTPDGTGFVCL